MTTALSSWTGHGHPQSHRAEGRPLAAAWAVAPDRRNGDTGSARRSTNTREPDLARHLACLLPRTRTSQFPPFCTWHTVTPPEFGWRVPIRIALTWGHWLRFRCQGLLAESHDHWSSGSPRSCSLVAVIPPAPILARLSLFGLKSKVDGGKPVGRVVSLQSARRLGQAVDSGTWQWS